MTDKTAPLSRELMASRILLRAVLPVARVVVEDDPKMNAAFKGVTAGFQIRARNGSGMLGAGLRVNDGRMEWTDGIMADPDICFTFKTPAAMNAFLTGGIALPRIKGLTRPALLSKFIRLLLSLKLLMPDNRPSRPDRVRLKIKLVMYMITTALSQYNKAGDPDMAKWTGMQPDRIYQMSCEPEGIAAYLRVKAGKSKAGRGYYKRKLPFVHMKFNGAENALPVFLNEVEFVEAISKGYVAVEGSPEYAAKLNDFMQRIQALIT
ncbi:MAG TPA: hypothetical protein DHV36_05340 [Desulfobacteraceae bacterium]|nr:hypothetical protein [Desulfobacteraceae bacterium]